MVARAVKEVTSSRGVQVEEDAGNNNDLFFQTGLEEVEAVGNGIGEALEVQPPSQSGLARCCATQARIGGLSYR